MRRLVEADEARDPIDLRTLYAQAIVLKADGLVHEIETFGLVIHQVPTV